MLGPAAAYFASKFGWAVFPLHWIAAGKCSCKRTDCGNQGKHPLVGHGFLDATRDAAQIEQWWSKWPAANIGIATGRASGLVVLDVDPRNGGDDSLEGLRLQHGPLPPTVQSRTGGGGDHYLFAYPALAVGERIQSGKFAPGLDLKADGGYIVAPPSVHASGRAYAWEASSVPGEVPFAAPPAWLLEGRAARPAVQQGGPAGVLEESFLYRVFAAAGWLGARVDSARVSVRCPWASDHTVGTDGRDTSTVLFAPSGDRTLGWFHCSHSHCAGRSVEDVLAAAPAEAVQRAKREEAADRAAYAAASTKQDASQGPPSGPRVHAGEKTAEPKPEDPDAWQTELARSKTGDVKNTYRNICLILRHSFGARLTFDAMQLTPMLDGQALRDADIGRAREDVEKTWGLASSDQNMGLAIRQVSEERSFHPVRSYLEGLTWDGELRIGRILEEVLHAAPSELGQRIVRSWFVSAVARALRPGCQVDTALVLVGPQGWRKSSFFRVLGGQWFADTAMDVSSKDGLMQLAAAWIYEWGEIENVTSRKEAAEIKMFVTSPRDTFRQPYGKAIIRHPRSSVIVGSTNQDQFLNDPTGSRRYHVVRVLAPVDAGPQGLLATWRDQLWAEAKEAFLGGYQWFLSASEDAAREADADEYVIEDALQSEIATWLRSGSAQSLVLRGGYLTVGEVLTGALRLDAGKWDKGIQTRVGIILRRLGWRKHRVTPQGETARLWVWSPAECSNEAK
jgi:hypothetical protein